MDSKAQYTFDTQILMFWRTNTPKIDLSCTELPIGPQKCQGLDSLMVNPALSLCVADGVLSLILL